MSGSAPHKSHMWPLIESIAPPRQLAQRPHRLQSSHLVRVVNVTHEKFVSQQNFRLARRVPFVFRLDPEKVAEHLARRCTDVPMLVGRLPEDIGLFVTCILSTTPVHQVGRGVYYL